LSAAALEKLRRETMSQKTFRDFRFTGTRENAARKRDSASSLITKTNDAAVLHSDNR
jgi:hypothetical protein